MDVLAPKDHGSFRHPRVTVSVTRVTLCSAHATIDNNARSELLSTQQIHCAHLETLVLAPHESTTSPAAVHRVVLVWIRHLVFGRFR